jgi:hypothetical protein
VAELFRAAAQHAEHRSWVFAATAADPGDIEAEGLGADDVEAVRRASRTAAVSLPNIRMNAQHHLVEAAFMRIVATGDECPEHSA